MSIENLTIKEARELTAMFGGGGGRAATHFKIGTNYLIRTVTMIQTGRLVGVNEQELLLEDAAWIADTGRFSTALQSCEFSEVEPYHEPVIVGRGAIVDAVEIESLPRVQR